MRLQSEWGGRKEEGEEVEVGRAKDRMEEEEEGAQEGERERWERKKQARV